MKEDRTKIGKKAVYIAIIGNIFLTIFNIVIGLVSGSYALLSEGLHTLSDVATSIIAYFGFKIGSKPADENHPLGHGRVESIAGIIIVAVLILMAFEIITGALNKIFFTSTISSPSYLAIFMAIIGILINILMSNYIIKIGKEIKSSSIVADGKHQRVDVFSSLAILIGVLVSRFGFYWLDPLIGLIIGLLILKTAFSIAKENVNDIMGVVPSKELLKKIEDVSNSVNDVKGTHDIIVNNFGSYSTITLHIELPGDLTLNESHIIAHIVQDRIMDEIDEVQRVTVHTCPVGLEYNHNQKIDN